MERYCFTLYTFCSGEWQGNRIAERIPESFRIVANVHDGLLRTVNAHKRQYTFDGVTFLLET